jgi:hypothetical protein
VLDGVYRTTEGVPVFHAVRAPTAEQLQTPLGKNSLLFVGARWRMNSDTVLGGLKPTFMTPGAITCASWR